MADLFTRTMLEAYDELSAQMMEGYALQRLFSDVQVSDSEYVDVDIMRDGREAAVDVVRRSDQSHINSLGEYTGKSYRVPLYAEEGPVTAGMLTQRMPGEDPFSPDSRNAKLLQAVTRVQMENTAKIARAIEKQAAEAMLSGTVTLSNGESLDFHKKGAHSVTPGTKWDNSGDPIADIGGLAETIFGNGKIKPNTLIFGNKAWQTFANNADVQSYLDNRRINPGQINPAEVENGMVFQGRFWVESYMFDAYTYPDFYVTGGTNTPYITEDSVIMMNRGARLVRAFGAVEVLPQYEAMYSDFGFPSTPQMVPGQFVPYAYHKPPRALMAGVQSAPLVIPAAIDTIGTLDNVDT